MTPAALDRLATAIARQKSAEARYYAEPASPVREEILGRDLRWAREEVAAARAGVPDEMFNLIVRMVEATQ